MTDPVKLQVGKWYRRRDGVVVGPVSDNPHNITGYYPFKVGSEKYAATGAFYYNEDAVDERDLIEEAPGPPATKPAWQPISTAPRDGTDILVWYDHDADPSVDPDYPDSMTAYALCAEFGEFLAGKGFTIAKWRHGGIEPADEIGSRFSMPAYWFSRGDYACYDRVCNPVYWAPIPETPEKATEDGKARVAKTIPYVDDVGGGP